VARTVVLGGGFGGLSVATGLRESVGEEHEIVLVDRSSSFRMGLRKLWAVVGIGSLEDGTRDRSELESSGIRFVQREILAIDPANRTVRLDDGSLAADYLVVALGAVPRPDLVPGLAEYAQNVWDVAGVPAMKEQLETFDGGEIVIAIAGMPYTCPPAPFECVMLLDDYLRKRGLRDRSSLMITTPKPILLPNAGVEGSAWLAEQLAARGIRYETGREVVGVEAGRVEYANGEAEFDLLVGVPPHRPPTVVAESGRLGSSRSGDFGNHVRKRVRDRGRHEDQPGERPAVAEGRSHGRVGRAARGPSYRGRHLRGCSDRAVRWQGLLLPRNERCHCCLHRG